MNSKDRVIVLGDVSHVTKGFMCRVKRPKVEGITKIRATMRWELNVNPLLVLLLVEGIIKYKDLLKFFDR
jgi:hypothetical protein